jgi:predicted DNA-binding ribbon-helix-helix protein
MKKRSVKIAGHATSITLENEFWIELKALAVYEGKSLNTLITEIDEEREESTNLSSAIRLAILKSLQKQSLTTER